MTWEDIVNADNTPVALQAHLASFLVDSDSDKEVLEKLMRQFQSVELDDGVACVRFGYVEYDDEVCEVVITKDDMATPIASLQKIAEAHGGISAESLGGGELAFPANNMVDDYLANEDAFPETPEIVFDVAQDIMIAHPTEKNGRGEPKLYFIDHEDGQATVLEGAEDLTAAQVFLRLLAQMIGCDEYFEQVAF